MTKTRYTSFHELKTATLKDAIDDAKEIELDKKDREEYRDKVITQEPDEGSEKPLKKTTVKMIKEDEEDLTVAVVNNNPPVRNNCHICGKKGYQATNCWSAPEATRPNKCQVCGKLGHTAEKCKISSGKN